MAPLPAVTEAEFQATVLEGALPTLVDFSAEWCAPCRMMAPVLEQVAEEQAGKLQVVQVDVQAEPGLAANHGVTSIPCLILFAQGQERERMVGYLPAQKLRARLAPYLT